MRRRTLSIWRWKLIVRRSLKSVMVISRCGIWSRRFCCVHVRPSDFLYCGEEMPDRQSAEKHKKAMTASADIRRSWRDCRQSGEATLSSQDARRTALVFLRKSRAALREKCHFRRTCRREWRIKALFRYLRVEELPAGGLFRQAGALHGGCHPASLHRAEIFLVI